MFANFSLNSIFKSKLLAGFAAFALAVSGMVAVSVTSAWAAEQEPCDIELLSGGTEETIIQALEVAFQSTSNEYGENLVVCLDNDFVFNQELFISSNNMQFANVELRGLGSAEIRPSIQSSYGFYLVVGEDNFGNLIINNIKFSASNSSRLWVQGILMTVQDKSLIVKNSEFRDLYSHPTESCEDPTVACGGGAISGYNISVEHSKFIGNVANGGNGGAIYAEGIVEVNSSAFDNNISNSSGGAIFATVNSSISNSTFEGNSADFSGGAVAVDGGDLTVSYSTFSDNSAEDEYGGAIWVDEDGPDDGPFSGGNLNVERSTFNDNDAYSDGGAVYAYLDVTVTGSTFSGNSSDENGGAVATAYGDVVTKSSTFNSNEANNGGAIYVYASGSLSIENATFYLNSAANEGGAIFASAGEINFSTFLNNSADGRESEPDIPGQAIYYSTSDQDMGTCVNPMMISANIFAGESISPQFPQIGVGGECRTLPYSEVLDLGGNIFTTLFEDEADVVLSESPFYLDSQDGFSSQEIFGEVASLKDNGGQTETLAIINNSPAKDFVSLTGENTYEIETDQRGFKRVGIYDAGAFEFDAVDPNQANTGSNSPTANGYSETNIGSVYFAPGSSRLSHSAKKQIQAFIAANPNSLYKVTGYVQKARTSKNDQRLSEARARAVEKYLVTLGAGVNFTVVVEAGKVPAVDGNKPTARRATIYSLTPVVK